MAARKKMWGALLALGVLVCMLLVRPSVAFAEDYRCTQVDLRASIETDGTVYFTDQRLFDFAQSDGRQERLTWLYEGFSEDAELAIQHVRMAEADAEGNVVGSWRELPSVTFELSWRDGGGSDSDAWSYDKFQDTLYAFVRNMPERAVFQVDYLVRHGVEAYDDAADFNWLFAPEHYAVDMENITATVVLPVPAETAIVPGENVMAWGHGPADGTVDIGLDGAVTFRDPRVDSEGFAFGRVMFPVLWLTNLSQEDRLEHQGELQYYWTARYEETWVDRDSHQRILADSLRMGLMGLLALLLAGGLVAYGKWGRERPPHFRDDYWCGVPAPGLPPAVVGRLWRWNHENPDDVVATVLDMVRRGRLCLASVEGRLALGVAETDPRMAWSRSASDLSEEAMADTAAYRRVDDETVALVRALADEEGWLDAKRLSEEARQRPSHVLRAVQRWQQSLTDTVAPYGFFDQGSRRAQQVVLIVAGCTALVAVPAWIILGWASGVITLAAAACLGVLGNYIMRRSPEGNEIAAHAKALRNWLRDGGVDEGGVAVEEQEELVPYAYLFGVLSSDAFQGDAGALAAAAPRLTEAFDDALRAAHHRAEVS